MYGKVEILKKLIERAESTGLEIDLKGTQKFKEGFTEDVNHLMLAATGNSRENHECIKILSEKISVK